MSSIEENVELLIHQLRDVVKKKKQEELNAFKNDNIIQLNKEIEKFTYRDSSEFKANYNIGTLKLILNLL